MNTQTKKEKLKCGEKQTNKQEKLQQQQKNTLQSGYVLRVQESYSDILVALAWQLNKPAALLQMSLDWVLAAPNLPDWQKNKVMFLLCFTLIND